MASANFTPNDCFNLYVEELNIQQNQEYLTFEDFCKLDFNSGYPEIIYDIFYGNFFKNFDLLVI